MVQLSILSGKMAGENQLIRHFPFLIGRSRENDLCLDDAGIWERHLKLVFQKKEGFTLETAADALATVNGQPQKSTRLRNGDIISIGSAKIQFWLAPLPLRGLGLRETLVWLLVAAVIASQLGLIYWLAG
jgi:pSer/pThr/pTyr-binding forkhead associated (FHA) protein